MKREELRPVIDKFIAIDKFIREHSENISDEEIEEHRKNLYLYADQLEYVDSLFKKAKELPRKQKKLQQKQAFSYLYFFTFAPLLSMAKASGINVSTRLIKERGFYKISA